MKILAIQFKSLGDTVMLIPALEAIREKFPDCELHALVSSAAAPLLQHLPCLNQVWSMPRVRGRAQVTKNWPFIRALRAEKFDRSVEFGRNDRGAILSLLGGARERLGTECSSQFLSRVCFNRRAKLQPFDKHEAARFFDTLSAWDIAPRQPAECKIYTDPDMDKLAGQWVPANAIVCHMGAGIPKKQWLVAHWAAFYQMAATDRLQLVFTPGQNERERAQVIELKSLCPDVQILPTLELPQFLSGLKHARALVTADTGPMHFAAGLGVPLVALFGPTSVTCWRPLGKIQRILISDSCRCNMNSHVCHTIPSCMAGIPPEKAFAALKEILSVQ